MLKKFNLPLLILPALIFTLGYLSLLSTAPDKAYNQLVFFIVGYAIYILFALIDYSVYKFYYKYLYIGMSLALLLTFVGGVVKFGSSSWIKVGPFVIQPAEFAKIVELIVVAAFIYITANIFSNLKKTLMLFGLSGFLCVLVLLQPDFGTTIVMLMVFAIMLLYANFNKLYFMIGISAFAIFSNPFIAFMNQYLFTIRFIKFANWRH